MTVSLSVIKTSRSFALAATILSSATLSGCAYHVPTNGFTVAAPKGYAEFCTNHAAECAPSETVTLAATPELMNKLSAVNKSVNASTRYAAEEDDVWTADAEGNCKTFAIRKKQALLTLGVDPRAMRFVSAEIMSGPGDGNRHVVLAVDTDKGAYLLDSLRDEVATPGEIWMAGYSMEAGNGKWTEPFTYGFSNTYGR